jgi:hypothetical protein
MIRIRDPDLWARVYAVTILVVYGIAALRSCSEGMEWWLLWPALVAVSALLVLLGARAGEMILCAYSWIVFATFLLFTILGASLMSFVGHGPNVTDADVALGTAMSALLAGWHGVGALFLSRRFAS